MPKWFLHLFVSSPKETWATESYRRGYKKHWIDQIGKPPI